MNTQHSLNAASCRYIPFAVFMAFIGLDEIIRYCGKAGLFVLDTTAVYYLYPVKAVVVAYLLFRFRERYDELKLKDLAQLPSTLVALATGLAVFFLWIRMDWAFGSPPPAGFNPDLLPSGAVRTVMTLFRVAGAVMVVPLMEELFWRSFLIRYIISKDFTRIPPGTFTWPSFIFTVLLFGLEHNYVLAGMMAGIIYNLLLYKTRSITHCVLAHAVTNLALALHVIFTGQWHFW